MFISIEFRVKINMFISIEFRVQIDMFISIDLKENKKKNLKIS